MKHTLTGLSQLSKAMFKTAPKANEVKPEPPKAKLHDDGEEVLAYFTRPAAGAKAAQKAPTCAPSTDGADARTEAQERDVAALCGQLRDSEAAGSDAEAKAVDLERERAKLADALAAAHREVERLKGECGRLRGEARKAAKTAPGAVDAKDEPLAVPTAARSTRGVLAPPAAFPGEMREMVLSSLSDTQTSTRSIRQGETIVSKGGRRPCMAFL